MPNVFSRIDAADVRHEADVNAAGFLPETEILFSADGEIPFPQIVVRDSLGNQLLVLRDGAIARRGGGAYAATVPGGKLREGRYQLQIEGCKTPDPGKADAGDWVKTFAAFEARRRAPASGTGGAVPAAASGTDRPKLYFCIHKHMHQPYYRAADPGFWDGACDEIFSARAGAYRHFIRTAASQYQALPHAGLSMSWSGSLVEQLDRASAEGLAHGAFGGDWKAELRDAARMRTTTGVSRAEFSGFGYYHPLMPLIPARDIKAQIVRHREMIRREFGVEASTILFPPETAFHVRIIPALLDAGVTAVIYDSIHRYRACRDYPYAGRGEGMLPPNPAEQENPPVSDWLQLHNVWAGSKISPCLLRPEFVRYTDVDGRDFRITAVPAERYIGNEDARGGFGALVYPDVLGQVLDSIERSGSFDPEHPPFFILHSDGDNYGGGADSYYGSNTAAMVEWLANDPRFELIAIQDYLDRFPPAPGKGVHIEPGSWSGADNGDPQFMKWFSGYGNPYSPDLNSWAVLTALQNAVHSLLDSGVKVDGLERAERLLLTAEASDYWYWTGQEIWDRQVTDAANTAFGLLLDGLDSVAAGGKDVTGPTIFPPWVTPENPGGQTWGNNGLAPAAGTGVVRTLIYDVLGVKSARLMLRTDAGRGSEREIPLAHKGAYPSRTGARITAGLYEAELPEGLGDVRYWIEAVDNNGNMSRGTLERVFLA